LRIIVVAPSRYVDSFRVENSDGHAVTDVQGRSNPLQMLVAVQTADVQRQFLFSAMTPCALPGACGFASHPHEDCGQHAEVGDTGRTNFLAVHFDFEGDHPLLDGGLTCWLATSSISLARANSTETEAVMRSP